MLDMLTNEVSNPQINRWVWQFLDVIYPPFCCGCGKFGFELCPNCLQTICKIEQFELCTFCGNPLSSDRQCARENEHNRFVFTQARSWGIYKNPLNHLLRNIKYKRGFGLVQFLTEPVVKAIKDWGIKADMVLPVPLAKKRLAERGYNQAKIIAQPIADYLQIPVTINALLRIRETKSQVGLNTAQRIANVQNAFLADSQVCRSKNILLFDDISTTFSTANACATALKAAGAKNIYCFSVARTIYQ